MLKHAGPGARTQVRLGSDRQGIVIEVLDDGRGRRRPVRDRTADDAGARAMASSGCGSGRDCSAGPWRPGRGPDGGFRVVAHLPTGGEPA